MTDEHSSTRDSDQHQSNPIYKKILINRKFKLDVRDVLAADSEEVLAKEAVGRISAEIKYKCPPGFPVLVYGEEILPEHIELFGPLEKLKVMAQPSAPLLIIPGGSAGVAPQLQQ